MAESNVPKISTRFQIYCIGETQYDAEDLCSAFCNGVWIPVTEINPNYYINHVEVDDASCNLYISTIGDPEEECFGLLTVSITATMDGLIILVNLQSSKSLENARAWKDIIAQAWKRREELGLVVPTPVVLCFLQKGSEEPILVSDEECQALEREFDFPSVRGLFTTTTTTNAFTEHTGRSLTTNV